MPRQSHICQILKLCFLQLVPRYRSKWQDHVGTSALRCRSLASYVPLCSDLSGSASCTAPCIAGRQSHCGEHFLCHDGFRIAGRLSHCREHFLCHDGFRIARQQSCTQKQAPLQSQRCPPHQFFTQSIRFPLRVSRYRFRALSSIPP